MSNPLLPNSIAHPALHLCSLSCLWLRVWHPHPQLFMPVTWQSSCVYHSSNTSWLNRAFCVTCQYSKSSYHRNSPEIVTSWVDSRVHTRFQGPFYHLLAPSDNKSWQIPLKNKWPPVRTWHQSLNFFPVVDINLRWLVVFTGRGLKAIKSFWRTLL